MKSNEVTADPKAKALHATKSATPLLFIAVLLTAATLRSPLTGVGSLITQIQASTGLTHTMAGMLTTLPLIAFGLFALVAPKLSSRFGMELTLLVSTALLIVGILVRSVPGIAPLFMGTALAGIAIAICNVLVPGLIKRDFPRQIGMMTGLYSSFMNLWAAIASGISIPLSLTFLGWRGSLAIWAVLALATALTWLPLLRRTSMANKVKPDVARNTDAQKSVQVWRSPVAWLVTIYMGFQSIMFYIGVSWLPEILHEQGMDMAKAGWMLSLMQILSMIGSFVMPLIATRSQDQRWITAASSAFFLLGFGGVWIGPHHLAPLYIMLIGLGCGTTFSLVITFFSLRSHTSEQAAAMSGMSQSIGYLLAAVGPTLFGYIHDVSGGWNAPLATIVSMSILTIVFGYAAGRKGYISSK
ncbi:MFS transporter [Paenibacillus sp. D2_2]|uniref:CynX/NimT family MFS transporter n=1 Tax=Paenibacillus sp. D2_2 TaxID=3073092 RepID=UPI002815CFF7|nr:MFS transporter [Paenibacillus sp. D2_2]WMT40640.1 MFS transporter [Paenibacillus sp. D2_2]